MKTGVCTAVGSAPLLEQAGYDYIEFNFTAMASMSAEEFETLRAQNGVNRVKIEALNGFCPASIRLTGPDVDEAGLADYAAKGFARAAPLGVRVVVVGSGAARKTPEGYDKVRALDDFGRSMRIIGDAADAWDIDVAIEPLNKGETDVLNTVAETASFVRALGHGRVKLMADFYHMRVAGEPMEVLRGNGDILRHLHLANYNGGRIFPTDPKEDDYASFFAAVKAAGYDGRVSVEAGGKDLAKEAPEALAVLRSFI